MSKIIPLTGYAEPLSAAPSQKINFKVSSRLSSSYQASIVRVIHGDPNPAGPGLKLPPVVTKNKNDVTLTGDGGTATSTTITTDDDDDGSSITTTFSFPSIYQKTSLGSYAITDETTVGDSDGEDGSFTIGAIIWPTLVQRRRRQTSSSSSSSHRQTIISRGIIGGSGSFFWLGVIDNNDDDDGESSSGGGSSISYSFRQCGDNVNENIITILMDRPLRNRCWYRIVVSYNATNRCVKLSQRPIREEWGVNDSHEVTITIPADAAVGSDGSGGSFHRPGSGGAYIIGASLVNDDSTTDDDSSTIIQWHFNGKIEQPFILSNASHAHSSWNDNHDDNHLPSTSLIAQWDASLHQQSFTLHDTGPHSLHAKLVNNPTRGVTSSRWNGDELCWRHAPHHYAAVYFHEDDLGDVKWTTSFELVVRMEEEGGLKSGAYAVRLWGEMASDDDDDDGTTTMVEDYIPFYIRPPPSPNNRPRILFLAPTFTYIIYGNHVRHNADSTYHDRCRTWPGASSYHPDHHSPLYGASTYNRHPDGSGICYSSAYRPLLTMRPHFLTFGSREEVAFCGSGLRHYAADTHILNWLEEQDEEFDVMTDDDLHLEGVCLLKGYNVILTGSHPEYHTKETRLALQSFINEGGNLMYMGGNGFYWRIARGRDDDDDDARGLLEVRRGEGGVRAWAAEVGEYYHVLDGGGYGGLWRRNGCPPQSLVGVGYVSQGLFEGSYYVRTRESYEDERVTWIFEGVGDDDDDEREEEEGRGILGNFGYSGGGAAGFELDRVDERLGTPRNTVVLARSKNHDESTFIPAHEEMLTHLDTVSGDGRDDLIRADMVYFETPGGGQVFSVGSITFCGSLAWNECDNDVSTIVRNVLRRFSQDKT